MTETSSPRWARWTFAAALLVLLAGEGLRIYWIMPFPGSQQGQTLDIAYGIHRWIWLLRLLAGAVALGTAGLLLRKGSWKARTAVVLGIALYAFVAYQANGPLSADVMFRQPTVVEHAPAEEAELSLAALVVGVALDDGTGSTQARAYPMSMIGYHHQVRDELAGQPVMVTYCTVCRTGRVFSPVVDGEEEEFRLVGMDRWNAMFEDESTGSWWRQATGKAVTGPRAGTQLTEIPSRQMTWEAWKSLYPETTVMRPDPAFADKYAAMEAYEEGTSESKLTGRDPASWQEKSWVVGVLAGGEARAFDWNELVRERVIRDDVGGVPVLLVLGADGASFYAYDARPGGPSESSDEDPLTLVPHSQDPARLINPETGATWTERGRALDGPLAGTRLSPLPAYQEFWHSWRTFQPETTARRPPSAGEGPETPAP